MTKINISHLCLTLLLLSGTTIANAAYQWKDDNGQMQYSDYPPPRHIKKYKVLDLKNTTPNASQAPLKSTDADRSLEGKKKQLEQADQEKKTEADLKREKEDKDSCTRSKNYLKSLEDGQRIAKTNDKGERVILDDAGRAVEILHAKSIIQETCKAASN